MSLNIEQSKKISCADAYIQIMSLDNLNYEQLPNIYKNRLTDMKMYGEKYQLYYTEINVDKYTEECLKQVIGKEGCYFKLTTQNYDIDFIWHDRKNKKIQFWGPDYKSIRLALSHINLRIQMYS